MKAQPAIYVLAGVNGSGKSSLGGALFNSCGVDFYNSDLAAFRMRRLHRNLTQEMANSHAWHLGKEMLEAALAKKETFVLKRL
ncbi:MAG: hypothetical protein AAF555_05895 [Verrucomicrobiota bacterium]